MKNKMVLFLTWYAKEMEPKRNYLNYTWNMVKLVQLFEESKSCRGKWKDVGQDTLHKGRNCEMATLVETLLMLFMRLLVEKLHIVLCLL
jgi:hypothetical protein